jgi:hypothetical protein
MLQCLATTDLWLSDGATSVLPVAPHRTPEGAAQLAENEQAVRAAMATHYRNVCRALHRGFYQGWDLHPAQVPVRIAALCMFFRRDAEALGRRLKGFWDSALRATRIGTAFDDRATVRGIVQYFDRAEAVGALTSEEIARLTGLDGAQRASLVAEPSAMAIAD